MALFKPWKGLSTNLDSLPKKEGQFIVTTDDEAIYLDISSKRRIRIDQEFKVVSELPTVDIDPNTVYLIEDSTLNTYTQYIYRENRWFEIGGGTKYTIELIDKILYLKDATSNIIIAIADFTNYALEEDIPTKVSELENDAGYALVEEIPTKVSELENDAGYGTYTQPAGGIPKTDLNESVQESLDKADTALQIVDIEGKEDVSNKVTSLSIYSTDEEYPSAKLVYDELMQKADTNDFIGTDGVTPGQHGLVPAPDIIDIGKFLSADGSWDNPAAMNNQEIIDIFYF